LKTIHSKHSKNNDRLPGFTPAMLTLLLILTSLLVAGCQASAGSTPTPSKSISSPSPTPTVPTSTPLPPTATIPPPTATEPPPEPTTPPPTEEPVQADQTTQVISSVLIPPEPKQGSPSGTATTVISVRVGPALNYPVYGLLLEGQVVELTGASEDGEWWSVYLPGFPLDQGWTYAPYVQAANADGLPTIQPPPLPPTLVFSQPSSDDPFVRFRETVYARSGPGLEYPVYGVIQQGDSARAVHKTEDGEWWQVVVYSNLVPTKLAWVPDQFIEPRKGGAVGVGFPSPVPGNAELPAPAPEAHAGIPMAPVYLRGGPGLEYPALGVAEESIPLTITGASPNLEWWQVQVPPSISLDEQAWISAPFVFPTDVDGVPVVEPPPVPELVSPFEPGAGDPWVLPLDNIIAYDGPGNEYSALGMLPANVKALVVGVSPDGAWYIVRLPQSVSPNGQGWVDIAYVTAFLQRGVPVIEPPAK